SSKLRFASTGSSVFVSWRNGRAPSTAPISSARTGRWTSNETIPSRRGSGIRRGERQAQRKTGMKMHLRHIAHVMLVALMVIGGNALAVDAPENYRLSESALQKYERATVAMYEFARNNSDAVKALKGSD